MKPMLTQKQEAKNKKKKDKVAFSANIRQEVYAARVCSYAKQNGSVSPRLGLSAACTVFSGVVVAAPL